MGWSLPTTILASVTALAVLARLAVWLALQRIGPFRPFVLLTMRAPAVLIADIWFRGCSDKTSLYGSIADIMERAGWWSDKWPGNHIAYLKYFAIVLAFCLIFVSDEVLVLIYKFFFNRMAVIQVVYIFSQQSVYRVGQGQGTQQPLRHVFDVFLLLDSFLCGSVLAAGDDAVSEGLKASAEVLYQQLQNSELPEWIARWLSSAVSTTLASFASVNSNVLGNVLILAPFFITWALESAGLPVWWVQWINGAMCRALALILLIVVVFYLCVALCCLVTTRNGSPLVTLTLSWLTLYAVNFTYRLLAVSTFPKIHFGLELVEVAVNSLNDSLESIVAYIGFSFAVGYVYIGIFRAIVWYAGIASTNIDFTAVRVGQTIVVLSYGIDMYAFAKPTAQNSFVGALTVILLSSSEAIVAHVQPVIESGVRSRRSSINALLLFCLFLFVLPLVATYMVQSSFGPTDWCSQTIVMTLFSCLQAVKFIGSYLIRNVWKADREKNKRYLRGFEKISMYANWTMACAMVFYYVVVFLSVDWSFTALYKALFVTLSFIYKPYADRKVANRRRGMAARLVSSFPAPDVRDHELANIDCAICLVSLERQNGSSCRSPCGHLFHKRCLAEWVRVKVTCPMCNQSIGNLQEQQQGAPGAAFFRRNDDDQMANLREFQQQMQLLQQLFAAAGNDPQFPEQLGLWQQAFANYAR